MASSKSTLNLPALTPDLVLRILSYQVQTTMDVAQLRLFQRGAATMINDHHIHIQVPNKRVGDRSFVHEFVRADDDFDHDYMTVGERWSFPDGIPGTSTRQDESEYGLMDVFDADFVMREMTFLKKPKERSSESAEFFLLKRAEDDEEEDGQEFVSRIAMERQAFLDGYAFAVQALPAITNPTVFSTFVDDCIRKGYLDPVDSPMHLPEEEEESDGHCHALLLKFELLESATCVRAFLDREGKKLLTPLKNDGTDDPAFLELMAKANDWEREDVTFFPFFKNKATAYLAVVTERLDNNRFGGLMFLPVRGNEDGLSEYLYEEEPETKAIVFDHVLERHFQHTVVEGVAIVDGAVSLGFQRQLNQHIDALALQQEAKGAVDYHPNSKDVVRDLVHPGLYSYVKDVTPLRAQVDQADACIFPNLVEETINVRRRVGGRRGPTPEKDFWGRPYESSIYQWLPTYFSIDHNGACSIEDYINNLAPRENHSDLYLSLATLFEHALPYMESVYSYIRALRPHLRDADEGLDYKKEKGELLKMQQLSFRGQKLQVITKIVDYELQPGQTHKGVWHVEGMSHEEIVLTCLYVPYRDDRIDGGNIRFQRAFLRSEAENIFSSVAQTRHSEQEDIIHKGLQPLGHVETLQGRLIVFPNSHVHQVTEMVNNMMDDEGGESSEAKQEGGNDQEQSKKKSVARRRIVVFFLVNPLKRIVSTREVAPQQAVAGGSMTLDDALAHRLALMSERKHHKQDWNVREIELCEH